MRFTDFVVQIGIVAWLFAAAGCVEQQAYEPHSYEELEGHTVSAMEGSIQQNLFNNELKDLDIKALYFTSITDCMLAVRQGKADIFFGADLQAFNEAFKDQHLKICHYVTDLKTPFAFGFKKGNTDLLNACNGFIDSLKRSGELDEIYRRWFKPTENGFHECVLIPPIPSEPGTSQNVLRIGVGGIKDPTEILIDNKWTGMEIELLQRFAALYGYALQIHTYDFASLIPALQADKIDIISASLIITEERKEKIDFSTPHAYMTGAFIVSDQTWDDSGLWVRIKESAYTSLVKENRWQLILEGLWKTILITILSLIGGTLLGGLVCRMRMSSVKWISGFAGYYIYFMRNIPMLVLLLIMFYVVLAGTNLSAVTVAIIAFSLSSAAFISEIFRSGIQSVDRGQTEAGRALGCTDFQAFIFIVAPQAAKMIMPVYKNECISLLKSTSIVGFISIVDMTKASDLIRSASFEAFFPLLVITVLYFGLASLLTWLLDMLIRKI